jgi:hypothetical protein
LLDAEPVFQVWDVTEEQAMGMVPVLPYSGRPFSNGQHFDNLSIAFYALPPEGP